SWEYGIPGKAGTMREGGLFKMMMIIPDECPNKPPKCTFTPSVSSTDLITNEPGQFNPPLFHPDVLPSGIVCLAILNSKESWSSVLSVKEILLGVQELLDNPNPELSALSKAYHLMKKDPARFWKKIWGGA
ncbi:UBC-like protein, partial [Aspergillus uvarum CBS 121591]